jgi:hypothetical protein
VRDAGIAAPGNPAKNRAHPRHHFIQIERLYDVVIGAGIESRNAVLDFIAGRENDDGGGISPFAQIAQHIDSVPLRQTEIEQHHIEWGRLQRGGRAVAVAHPVDGEARLAKRGLQALRYHAVVFYEQYTHSSRRPE